MIEIGRDYALREAEDVSAFARFVAFYRKDPLPGASLGYRTGRFCDHTACWWIERGGARVGGVVLAPNAMTSLFLIPPFEGFSEVVLVLTAYLREISDPRLSIRASDVYEGEMAAYFRIGYQLMGPELMQEPADDFSNRFYCMMLRPTEALPVETPAGIEVLKPTRRDIRRIARFLHGCYDGADLLRSDVEAFEETVADCFSGMDNPCREASAMLRREREIVGVALVTGYEGWPLLFDIGVAPGSTGRGLARFMVRRALTVLHGRYPALRLFVELGNPAQVLYHGMGFIASEPMVTLALSGWGKAPTVEPAGEDDKG